eukprot:910249-Prorocentrum_minimum.AAC.1
MHKAFEPEVLRSLSSPYFWHSASVVHVFDGYLSSSSYRTLVTPGCSNAGDDPNGYESACERWSPVETIMISIISMLSSPNSDSPANIDAAVSFDNIITAVNQVFSLKCRLCTSSASISTLLFSTQCAASNTARASGGGGGGGGGDASVCSDLRVQQRYPPHISAALIARAISRQSSNRARSPPPEPPDASPGVDCRPTNGSLSTGNIRRIFDVIFEMPCAECYTSVDSRRLST